MPSSGTLRRVALARTDVSEEQIAYIIRVTRIGELGTTLAVSSNESMLRRNTNITEDGILHSHRRENLKSYIISCSLTVFSLAKTGNICKVNIFLQVLSLVCA
jgi:hypothetical protein